MVLNLPHTFDLVRNGSDDVDEIIQVGEVTTYTGRYDIGYDIRSRGGGNFPSHFNDVGLKQGEYAMGNSNIFLCTVPSEGDTIIDDDKVNTRTREGVTLSYDYTAMNGGMFTRTTMQGRDERLESFMRTETIGDGLPYLRIDSDDRTFWRGSILDFTKPITFTISISDSEPMTIPADTATFLSRIKCLTSQLTRSLDNEYDERYFITTPYIVPETYTTLYLNPVPDLPSGLNDGFITALQVERVENNGAYSTITAKSVPNAEDIFKGNTVIPHRYTVPDDKLPTEFNTLEFRPS